MRTAVKMAEGADDWIEGLAAPFGGPFNGKDLEGEWFSARTDFVLPWFDEIPLLYGHGRDKDVELEVVGRVKARDLTDDGIWAKAQLDKQSKYFKAISEMVAQGRLFFSSGAMPHLVKTNKSSGEVLRWPWVELSLTPTPMNLLATVEKTKAIKHFEDAGLDTAALEDDDDALKALAAGDGASGGYTVPEGGSAGFAYVDKNGRGHLPIQDAAHVRAAISRFNQTKFESPAKKKTAARKVLAAAKKLSIDVADDSAVAMAAKAAEVKDLPDGPTMMGDDDGGPWPEGSYEDLANDIACALRDQSGRYAYVVATFPGYALVRCYDDYSDDAMGYWRVAYTLDDQGEPVLGQMEQVQPAMIPVGKSADLQMLQTDEAPLAIQSARLADYAALLLERTKGVLERRIKESRELSTANRTSLSASADALESVLKELRDLLSRTEPQTAKAASVDRDVQHEFLALTTRLRRHQFALALNGD